jgi:RNA polymerase-binding transcription factor DksA
MDAADVCDKDNEAMLTEWQRARISAGTPDIDNTKPKRCIRCDAIIPARRLLAVPNTKYCVNCQRKIEQDAQR